MRPLLRLAAGRLVGWYAESTEPDLDFVGSEGGNNVAWYENDGSGNFGSENVVATDIVWPRDVEAADIDGDGYMDVVASSDTGGRVVWYRNTNGLGTFASAQDVATGITRPTWINVVDIDGDTELDVVAAYESGTRMGWYRNTDGLGTFAVGGELPTPISNYGPYHDAGDVDGDGDMDLLSVSGEAGVVWYRNSDGNGAFDAPRTVSEGFNRSAVFGDFDGDLDLDVVFQGTGSLFLVEHLGTDPLDSASKPIWAPDAIPTLPSWGVGLLAAALCLTGGRVLGRR